MAQNSVQTGFWQAWGLALGLIGVGALAGGYLGTRWAGNASGAGSSDAELHMISNSVQSGLQSAVESMQFQALAIQGNPALDHLPGMFRTWAEVDGRGLGLTAVRRTLQDSSRSSGTESSSLQAAMEQARRENIGAEGPGAILVRPDPDRLTESLWMVFPVLSDAGAGKASHPSTVFTLVEPSEVFPIFARTRKVGLGDGLRIYLLSENGVVLAHTTPSYIGTLFKNTPVHEAAAGHVGAVVETTAIDRIPVLARYEPMSGFPWVIGVEQVRLRSVLAWSPDQAVELGGCVFLLLALSLIAARSVYRRGAPAPAVATALAAISAGGPEVDLGLPQDLFASPRTAPSPAVPPPPSAAVLAAAARSFAPSVLAVPPSDTRSGTGATLAGPIGAQINGRVVHAGPASGAFDGSKWQELRSEVGSYARPLPDRSEATSIVTQFEKDALRLRDPRKIAARMVQEATRLTGSPTMFFGYEPRSRLAQLTVDAGLTAEEAPATLSFPIDESVFRHIVECEKRGELASLSEYPPLVQMIQARMGIGHFEAWAVAGYGPLGPRSGLPRLSGVFVLLQSGVDSYTRRDSLSKMIRATGLIYENSLHSRPNP